MIREFWLEGGLNNWSLMDLYSTGFLYQPQGLGYENSDEFTQIDSFWVPNKEKLSQTDITGQLLFGFSYDADGNENSPYLKFFKFAEYIRSASKDLVFVYKTDAGTYRKDVTVSSLTKGEINTQGVLSCEITFKPKTPWYRRSDAIVLSSSVDEDAKAYVKRLESEPSTAPGGYDYSKKEDNSLTGGYVYLDFASLSKEFQNNGSIYGALDVTFTGEIINPKIEVLVGSRTGSSYESYQSVQINGTIPQGATLEYSSRPSRLRCTMINNEQETNLALALNPENDNWIRLPFGSVNDGLIQISSEESAVPRAEMYIYYYYKAV